MEYSTPWNMAFVLFMLQIHEASSSLPQARNVRVESYNMGAVLKWEAPRNPPKGLVYTAQFSDGFESDVPLCQDVQAQQCDFGPNISSCFGHYKLRVRTELGGRKSKWSNVEFVPLKETVIGPPKVALRAKGGAIEMTIEDPPLRVSSPLTLCYSKVNYAVKYWKEGQENDVSEKLLTKQPHRFWPLESGAKYCFKVRVQLEVPAYGNKADYTEPMCEMTPGGEKRWPPPPAAAPAPPQLVRGLAALAVLLPVMLLTAWLVHRGRRFLNPKVSLPPHFKQAPGVYSVFLTLEDASTPPEQYDTISSLYEELPYDAIARQSPWEDAIARQSPWEDAIARQSPWEDDIAGQSPYRNITRQSSYQDVPTDTCPTRYVVDTCLVSYRNM